MIKNITCTALPEQLLSDELLMEEIARQTGVDREEMKGIHLLRKSLDARRKPIRYQLNVDLYLNEPFVPAAFPVNYQSVHHKKQVAIIGAGPAGLFAALRLIELGFCPVIFERGKDVRERRRDLAMITREHAVDPDSNYCFGEGGAGTYSDGKLYTRSSKRGDVSRILKLLVHHGADPSILYEAHPHIGTNKLPAIIATMREHILECGGQIHFKSRVTDLIVEDNHVKGLKIGNDHQAFESVLLATGHSARDIFELLHRKNILIEAKPFALGVRIEHPQEVIDKIQYKCGSHRDPLLPPASYGIVEQIQGKGVFSFCMCPGGIIAPAMTAANEIVVNGWSPSKHNNPYANSGMVVSVDMGDVSNYAHEGPLALLRFQQAVERACYTDGSNSLQAPAQRMSDFVARKLSASLPVNSYLPGVVSRNLHEVLPDFIAKRLANAFLAFGAKMHGYLTSEAILVATESRTSSPVRIPRNKETFEHVQVKGLYPCSEGAGYAGGIVSAAMDGENCAAAIARSF